MKNFFKSGTSESMMRLGIFILIIAAVFYIIYFSIFKDKPIDWLGLSAFCTGILGAKAAQSFSENKSTQTNPNPSQKEGN